MIDTGSKVRLHFVLRAAGDVVGTSTADGPYTYVLGRDEMPPGLQAGVKGLEEGDRRRFLVPPERAYGSRDPEAVQAVPLESFRGIPSISVGDRVRVQGEAEEYTATIAEIGDDQVKLDLNHPLAGKALEYEVEVVEVF